MAEDLVIRRGNIGTKNMMLTGTETPTADWMSIIGDNTGIIRGNYQGHLSTEPASIGTMLDWTPGGGAPPAFVAEWYTAWPLEGSFGRLSFSTEMPWITDGSSVDWIIQVMVPGYTATLSCGTYPRHLPVNYGTRIALDFQKRRDLHIGLLSFDAHVPFRLMLFGRVSSHTRVEVSEFSLYCAEVPL